MNPKSERTKPRVRVPAQDVAVRKRLGINGRPTLYREEYCDLVVKEMSEGLSVGGFAGLVLVSRQTIDEWMHGPPGVF